MDTSGNSLRVLSLETRSDCQHGAGSEGLQTTKNG